MFWGAGINWEGPFPGQQLLYPLLTGLGIILLLIATTVPLLESGKSWEMLRAKALILIPLAAVAALAALASGWAPITSWTVTPGAV